MKRIAIVGLGVSGSYLSSMLKDNYHVVAFERVKEDKFDYSICAWGTCKNLMKDFAKNTGLNFEDYILHDGKEMQVKLSNNEEIWIKLKGLCTYDKHRLIMDMINAHEVHFDSKINHESNFDDFDLVIDATSMSRALLPRLDYDIFIPCLEYRVKFKEKPFDDFYIKPFDGLSGYLWYFPLDKNEAHVGAGDFYKRHISELKSFMNQNGGEIIRTIGRPIRITPPPKCLPFYNGKVVGVGEAIGTVYPLLGEGIIPSLQCSDLLLRNLYNLKNYEREVLKKFSVYGEVFEFIRAKIKKEFSWRKNFKYLLSMYLHMKFNEKRYGMNIKLRDMIKVIKTF
ncbi:MAG: NAD(P)/FAD-dependent oxidoreductase [Nitrososphaerales archaeon]